MQVKHAAGKSLLFYLIYLLLYLLSGTDCSFACGGSRRSTALTKRVMAPMPVQAAHCCADNGFVEKMSPPNCTMSTCRVCNA